MKQEKQDFTMPAQWDVSLERILLTGLAILGIDMLVLACCITGSIECSICETAAKLILLPLMIVLILIASELVGRKDGDTDGKSTKCCGTIMSGTPRNIVNSIVTQVEEKIEETGFFCPNPMKAQLRQLEELQESAHILLERRFGGTAVTHPAFADVIVQGSEAVLKNIEAATIYMGRGEKTNKHVDKLIEANDKVLDQMASLIDSLRADEVKVCTKRSEDAALRIEELTLTLKKYPLHHDKNDVAEDNPLELL